jgi:hypothetical protein
MDQTAYDSDVWMMTEIELSFNILFLSPKLVLENVIISANSLISNVVLDINNKRSALYIFEFMMLLICPIIVAIHLRGQRNECPRPLISVFWTATFSFK